MNQTHFTLGQSSNMLRRAKPPFASLAVSCHAHAVFSAWFQISNHFLLYMTKHEMYQWSEVPLRPTRQFPWGLHLEALEKFAWEIVLLSLSACVPSHFSHVWLGATLETVARQAPLSMGFSRQEYCSGVLCPPPGDLPDPGIKFTSLVSSAFGGRFFTTRATWEVVCFL